MTTTNSRHEPRRLPVQWLEQQTWPMLINRNPGALFGKFDPRAGRLDAAWLMRRSGPPGRKRGCPPPSAFTILEMLVVVTIIGFLAAMAMPHLTGMTQANTMTAAVQQMSSAVSLAKQYAVSRRSTVYLVFDYPGAFSPANPPLNNLTAYNSLASHQYTAYAIMSLRTVGDQPGRPNPQYLTDWKTLPDGVFIPAFMFTPNPQGISISTTNTLSPQPNNWRAFKVFPFDTFTIPFPAANSTTAVMPCIEFTPQGQVLSPNGDQYIPLARGAIQYLPGTGPLGYTAIPNENPTGNSINNPNLIHIDSFTARPKLERNQF